MHSLRRCTLILKIVVSTRSREKCWKRKKGVTEKAKPHTVGIPVEAIKRAKMYLESENRDNRGEGKRNSKGSARERATSESENSKLGKTKERTFDSTLLEPCKNNWRFQNLPLINHEIINKRVKGHLMIAGLQIPGLMQP